MIRSSLIWCAHGLRLTTRLRFVLNWTDSLVQGLNTLAQGGVDVILLDLGLPDSHGYETFLTAKTYTPAAPIIVLANRWRFAWYRKALRITSSRAHATRPCCRRPYNLPP